MLLVILQAGLVLLGEQIMRISELSETQNAPLPFWAAFLLGLGFIAFAIIWQMMYLGFLKTASQKGLQSVEPIELVRSGRSYFWRVLVLQILVGCVVMLISYLLLMGFGMVLKRNDLPQWLIQVCTLIGTFAVLKPMLIITARILVYDQNALEGIFYVNCYSLSALEGLVEFIFSAFSFLLILTVMVNFIPEGSIGYYIYTVLYNMVFSLFMLLPTLTVVLFVQRVYEEANEQKEKETTE